jgi:hypothetical protein
MARKNTHLHTMKVAGSAALNMAADITTDVTNVQYLDNIGIQIAWSGTAPVGEISIQVSNDYDAKLGIGTWTELDFGLPILITGNSGDHLININQVPFVALRLFYDSGSGTGTMTATACFKQIGG